MSDIHKPMEVLIVRSKKDTDAVVRLTSDALHIGLQQKEIKSYVVHPLFDAIPDRASAMKKTCIIFHYDDGNAIAMVRSLLKNGSQAKVVCLGSDIYDFEGYVAVHDIVDFYLVPTNQHRQVLLSKLYKPVFVLHEAIDSTVLSKTGTQSLKGLVKKRKTRHLCWFGYSESFDKGMASLVPVIQASLARNEIDSFTAILNKDTFINQFGIATLSYEHTNFTRIAKNFDYVILSHFALDLSVNSMIKSPNKAVTSLVAGLIPLATDTPSYGTIFRQLGLEKFLFSSPKELKDLLKNIDYERDSDFIRKNRIVAKLTHLYSPRAVANEFLDIYSRLPVSDNEMENLEIAIVTAQRFTMMTLSEHIFDIGPSALRMIQDKIKIAKKKIFTEAQLRNS